ncbi:hypothetical protein Bbelb_400840 [Branchiostoma belcheri]|nr:hypothetical protein Bbelb_400840 [Branchiostoma belcheri]
MKPVTWSDHPFEPNEIPIPATIGQHQKLGKDSPYQIPLAHLREKFVDSAWSRRLELSLRQLTLSSSSSVPHSCEEPPSRQEGDGAILCIKEINVLMDYLTAVLGLQYFMSAMNNILK